MNNKKILNKLIKESFPELKKKSIKIIESKSFRNYGFYLPIVNIIFITTREKFSDAEKIGLLVHEICHAEQSSQLGFFGSILLLVNYWIFKKTRKRTEVQADKIALKKGYANELLEMTKKFEKEFGKKRYGLSSKQIIKYNEKGVF